MIGKYIMELNEKQKQYNIVYKLKIIDLDFSEAVSCDLKSTTDSNNTRMDINMYSSNLQIFIFKNVH